MAEPTPFNLTDAVKPDGFIDFYQMLGVSPDTPTDAIRTRINELYSEAQANRDHRNLNKRRDYQSLLEYLPHARTALLDADKRAQYDAYAAEASAGAPSMTFEAFMGHLSGTATADAERTDVLGMQDATTKGATTTRRTPSASTPRPRQTVGSSAARQSLIGTAISVAVFFVLLILLNLVARQDIGISLLIAAIVGAVTWFITHRGSKVGL